MKLKINRVIKNWKFAQNIVIENNSFIINYGSFGRRFKMQETALHYEDAFKEFNLKPDKVEPTLKNFFGNHFAEGASVHNHIDSAPEGFVHTRCNLMLKKPLEGGNPVLDGEEIQVNENDLWLCLASLERHWTTPIKGGERFIFSFGGLVPKEQIAKIIA